MADKQEKQEASFQIRHVKHGLFQSQMMGGAVFHPKSGVPELGIYRFGSEAEAKKKINSICDGTQLKVADFTVEPWDGELSMRLKNIGRTRAVTVARRTKPERKLDPKPKADAPFHKPKRARRAKRGGGRG